MSRARLAILVLTITSLTGCVVEKIPLPEGPGSFRVTVEMLTPWAPTPECTAALPYGTRDCVRPFPDLGNTVRLRVSATALDQKALAMTDYNGSALVDVRPGEIVNGNVGGDIIRFAGGVGELEIEIAHAYGKVRVWVEDCGTANESGSFATGVGEAMWFDLPRLDQLNATTDNTTSPMTPRATNVCAITGDPRFGLGVDNDGNPAFVGLSNGGAIDAPPPAMGTFVEVIGCSRDEYDALQPTGCERGPLVVTSIGNEGFYMTDIAADAWTRGFNHLYGFTFNYPDNLEVGDIVLSMRGAPVEFAGSTQIGNPLYVRDGVGRGKDLLPDPAYVDPAIYAAALRSYGRNDSEGLDLERLEGAVVCMDNLAPASRLEMCDVNSSGNIERQGCLIERNAPLPPRCDVGMGSSPTQPTCSEDSRRPYCLPLTEEALEQCALTGYLPANPAEYCCERNCYEDLDCSESSSYIGFGQWVADVYGRYVPDDASPVKIALITRDANPDFDPIAFGAEQRLLPPAEQQRVRIIGNLRQVLAARPVWVVTARTPADIAIGESCPQP